MYDLNFYSKLSNTQRLLNLSKDYNLEQRASFQTNYVLGDIQKKLNCEEKIMDDWLLYLFQYKNTLL